MADPKDVAASLAALRELESSGGDYTARNPTSSASGAYQFTDATWLSRGGGAYAPRAYLATPAQQDEIAAKYVASILDANGGAVATVPEIWYVGSLDYADSYVPKNNALSVGEYVRRWMVQFATHGGGTGASWRDTPDVILGTVKDDMTRAIEAALGVLAAPFLKGLRRISIVGLAVLGGVALVVAGGWRGVKASG